MRNVGAVASERAPLLLGSSSARRQELLRLARIPYVVHAPSVDETVLPDEPPDRYLARIVRAKLEAVRAEVSPELVANVSGVLVADTSVIDGESILGKPVDRAEARTMMNRLAGRTHEVHTRFVIGDVQKRTRAFEQTVITKVTFRPMSRGEVDAYVESGEGDDKAGAYAAQGLGATFVAHIEGSYSNVVGLPICEVVVALRDLGLV